MFLSHSFSIFSICFYGCFAKSCHVGLCPMNLIRTWRPTIPSICQHNFTFQAREKLFYGHGVLLAYSVVCLFKLVYNPYIVSSLVNVQRKLLARLFCIHTNRQKCGWMNSSNSNPMDGWSIKMLLLLIVLVLCQNIVEDLPFRNCDKCQSLKLCIPINCSWRLDLLA